MTRCHADCGQTCDKVHAVRRNHTPLPVEPSTELPDARIARTRHLAELTAAEITARVFELRVIENVKKFRADLESHRLPDIGSFRNAEIGVADPRAMEKLTIGVAELTQGPGCKRLRQKVASRVVFSLGVLGRTIRILGARILNHDLPHKIRHIRVWAAG